MGLGGSSSARDSNRAAPTIPPPTVACSGFWLYANPMRVIPSLVFVLWRRAARLSTGEKCVVCSVHSTDARAQDRCHRSSSMKIRSRILLRNDFFSRSDLMIPDPRRFATIFGEVDLEIREESGRLGAQQSQHRDRAATNLHLGALARSQLQHRPPCARIAGDDDLRLG